VLLGIQVFTMAVSFATGVAVIRLRKTKATNSFSLDDFIAKY